ncbi:hypothetical protein [Sinanaerobacter chloroacetimidivorans]|jgi:hypothetical protein|uniref:Uncharacterized protein n=1 Tax=Sinanaerobacter chloroacetimidivorans TaxID=2818044 RepID=A0A8J8B366_9FIRM|nr:hypothetical protein [Sinanaerobacter chloroacetimidivorans]MBR0599437.1 hypothetical protein [Sinanaerobacter chloroacetimidivorans]
MSKVFVEVNAHFNIDGIMVPRSIVWEDGRTFLIDKVIDVRRAASLKAGGQGIRYTCMIAGKERYLYYENPGWFVEGK